MRKCVPAMPRKTIHLNAVLGSVPIAEIRAVCNPAERPGVSTSSLKDLMYSFEWVYTWLQADEQSPSIRLIAQTCLPWW